MKQSDKYPRCSSLYRAQLSCRVGRDALEGKIELPDGIEPIEWAMFNLLHAIEAIAKAMDDKYGA